MIPSMKLLKIVTKIDADFFDYLALPTTNMFIAEDNYLDIISYLPLVDLWNCLFVNKHFNAVAHSIIHGLLPVDVSFADATVYWVNTCRDYPLIYFNGLYTKVPAAILNLL